MLRPITKYLLKLTYTPDKPDEIYKIIKLPTKITWTSFYFKYSHSLLSACYSFKMKSTDKQFIVFQCKPPLIKWSTTTTTSFTKYREALKYARVDTSEHFEKGWTDTNEKQYTNKLNKHCCMTWYVRTNN